MALRPPNLKDLTMGLNGSWRFLGKITTTGAAAVDNGNTAVPFYYQPRSPGDTATGLLPNLEGTLAGKVLLVMPVDDAMYVAMSPAGATLAEMRMAPVTTASGSNPGLRFGVNERPNFVMGPTQGWLQTVSEGGGVSTLLVWEQLQ
jgi:hypothetical protein